jgi:hypothetical protein
MRQTDQTIKALKPRAARYDVPYERGAALHIRVEPTGAKSFLYRGRDKSGAGRKKILGKICGAGGKPIPDAISLTTAKRLADEMRTANVDNGVFLPEPIRAYFESRQTAQESQEPLRPLLLTSTQLLWLCEAVQGVPAQPVEQEEGPTVEDAWRLYMEREGGKRGKRTAEGKERIWRNHLHVWASRPIRSITDDDCVGLLECKLKEAHARGEFGTGVNHVHKAMTRFFNWCMTHGRGATGMRSTPMLGIPKVVDETLTKRPPRPLSAQELRWLFQALAEFARVGGGKFLPDTAKRAAQALEFLLRSGCRRGNIFDALWGHVEAHGLFLPKTKNSTPLMVPLHPSMAALIGKRETTTPDHALLWDAGDSFIGRAYEIVRQIMNRLAHAEGWNGDFTKEFIDGERNLTYTTLHDFRDSLTTILSRPPFRVASDDREALLNHRPATVESKHYNGDAQDAFWKIEERTEAGALWNDYLDRVKAEAINPTAKAA